MSLVHRSLSKRVASHLQGAIASFRLFSSQAAPALTVPELPPCDFIPPPYTGPSKDEVLALRKQFLNPGNHLDI